MNENLIPNIRAYASARQLDILEALGSGKDGIVMVAKSKSAPAKLAVKAHRFSELYSRERAVYQRLEKTAVTTILGFNIPKLIGFDDEQQVIAMTIVKRPFVLDLPARTWMRVPNFRQTSGRIGKRKNASNLKNAGRPCKKLFPHLKSLGFICSTCPRAILGFG